MRRPYQNSVAAKIEAILRAAGRPLTIPEIAQQLGMLATKTRSAMRYKSSLKLTSQRLCTVTGSTEGAYSVIDSVPLDNARNRKRVRSLATRDVPDAPSECTFTGGALLVSHSVVSAASFSCIPKGLTVRYADCLDDYTSANAFPTKQPNPCRDCQVGKQHRRIYSES